MEFDASRVESFAASPPVPHAPLARAVMVAAEAVAQSAGDAIGSHHDVQLLEDALRNASSALEGGAAESAAFAGGRLASLLQSLEGSSTPQTQAALKDPIVLATLERMVDLSQTFSPPPGMPSDFAAALGRFAEAANAGSGATAAAASAEFATLVNEFGSATIMQALSALTQSSFTPMQTVQTPNFAMTAAVLPQALDDGGRQRSARNAVREEVDEAPARARRERDVPIEDEHGRPYTAEERSRLARLWFDPRRGFAPEARVAIAAWTAFGLELDRDHSGRHDYRDVSGEPWDIVTDTVAARCERAVAASPGVNLILCKPDGTVTLRMRDA